MKILLSAYACEPNRGSEPGIGWNWALELARMGHELHVLTRANNEMLISQQKEVKDLPNLTFIYFDQPGLAFSYKKKLGMLGVYWYYSTWQKGALAFIRKNYPQENYDLVHHITFGVHRMSSYLWQLEAPFVFGPLGGGEKATEALTKSMPFKARVAERIRAFSNYLARHNKTLIRAFRNSELIFTRTEFTRQEIPADCLDKTSNHVDIGIHLKNREPQVKSIEGKEEIKILFVGRMLYWKGIHLALRAFQRLHKKHPKLSFSLIGNGKDKIALQKLSKELEIEDRIHWISNIPQQEVFEKYKEHDLFLFPSFHDSGGSVVLEAMSYALPVVSLNLGGPSILVNNESGVLVEVENKSVEEIIEELETSIEALIDDPKLYAQKSLHTCERIKTYTWENQVRTLYEKIGQIKEMKEHLS